MQRKLFSFHGSDVDSHIQGGDEAEAESLSGSVVLVLEAAHHSLPHILRRDRNTAAVWRYASWRSNLSERPAVYLRVGGLVHDLQQKRLVLVSHLVFGVSQSIHQTRQNWADTEAQTHNFSIVSVYISTLIPVETVSLNTEIWTQTYIYDHGSDVSSHYVLFSVTRTMYPLVLTFYLKKNSFKKNKKIVRKWGVSDLKWAKSSAKRIRSLRSLRHPDRVLPP